MDAVICNIILTITKIQQDIGDDLCNVLNAVHDSGFASWENYRAA